jgi:hypothetical protein
MSILNLTLSDKQVLNSKIKGSEQKKYAIFQNLYTRHVSNLVSEKVITTNRSFQGD